MLYDTDDWIQWVLMSDSGDVTLLKTCKNWAKGVWGRGFAFISFWNVLECKMKTFPFGQFFGWTNGCANQILFSQILSKIYFFFFTTFLQKKLYQKTLKYIFLFFYFSVVCCHLLVFILWPGRKFLASQKIRN